MCRLLASAGTWFLLRFMNLKCMNLKCSVGWILTCSHHFKSYPFLLPGDGVWQEDERGLDVLALSVFIPNSSFPSAGSAVGM